MKVIGIKSEGAGTNNQIRGVILEGAEKKESVPVTRDELLCSSDGLILHPKNFESTEAFEKAVQKSVDNYLTDGTAPEYVIIPVDHAASKNENENVDLIASAVKKAFAKNKIEVKTMALASNLYDYKNVDLIHVGKHLLSDTDEKMLSENNQLKSRVVETLGVPSNLSWLRINTEANAPQKKDIIDKFRGKKNVLFSLGGKTDNGAIQFTLKDAEKLFESAKKLMLSGYNVIFTNSPRTPNDVTDYLYEKCKLYEKSEKFHISFFNSKKVATTEEEKKNFRIYDGKYNKEFNEQLQKTGNIYPAVLSLFEGNDKGFVINTHDSFSYTSDAAALGIPSVVYTENEINSSRPDCHKLFKICSENGYVIDLNNALTCVANGKEIKTKKMDDVSKQLVQRMTNDKDKNNIRSKTTGIEM